MELQNLSNAELQVCLPKVCEWIADMNWPVAYHVADFLVNNAATATPYLIDILRSDDVIWKHNALAFVVAKFDSQVAEPFKSVVTEQLEFYKLQAKDEDVMDFLMVANSLFSRLK